MRFHESGPSHPNFHCTPLVGRSRLCQTGTVEDDRLRACVATTDGNVVVAGYSQGSVDGTASTGNYDIVAVKLNVSSGEEIWTYQVWRTTHCEVCRRNRVATGF